MTLTTLRLFPKELLTTGCCLLAKYLQQTASCSVFARVNPKAYSAGQEILAASGEQQVVVLIAALEHAMKRNYRIIRDISRNQARRSDTHDSRPFCIGKEVDPRCAAMILALKRIDHLACDTHLCVDVALLDPTPDGMPNDDEAEALNDIEDELEEMITGDAVYFGRETVHGRRALH